MVMTPWPTEARFEIPRKEQKCRDMERRFGCLFLTTTHEKWGVEPSHFTDSDPSDELAPVLALTMIAPTGCVLSPQPLRGFRLLNVQILFPVFVYFLANPVLGNNDYLSRQKV